MSNSQNIILKSVYGSAAVFGGRLNQKKRNQTKKTKDIKAKRKASRRR